MVRPSAEETRKAAGRSGRRGAQGSLALFGFQLRELLEDEGVRVIGELGDEREVVPTEAIRVIIRNRDRLKIAA